jgi:hypothetical protein
MRQPACFIASAFGYKDVDTIYTKAIVSVLRELGVKPLRVDRINHNDRIDSKIIDLINQCDFGIADLSFARPSVYFEAGFIEGLGKNVIYIVRSDHFKHKDTDLFGNERIHFDLITKNIIPWTVANDRFKGMLRKRVNLILKTVKTQIKDNKIENDSRLEFKKLSLIERRQSLQDICLAYIEKKKLKPVKFRYIREVYGNRRLRLQFEILESLTQNDLRIYSHHSSELSNSYTINVVRVFCVMSSLPQRRIETALPHFQPINDEAFQYKTVKYIFWDNIDSAYKLTQHLKGLTVK